MTEQHYLVIFDGICNFCNGAVNFIINRDPEAKFKFSPIQSKLSQEIIKKHGVANVGIDTFLLVKNGRCYIWTDAAMEISKDLSGSWYLFNIFRVIPSSARDYLYRVFARNRYKLFGKSDNCMVPTEELRSRFVGM